MSNSAAPQTVDYLMSLNDQGVVVHGESNVVLDALTEWLDTARGSVFGNPSWGHELDRFKHEVMNDDLAVSVENSIARGVLRDLSAFSAVTSVSVSISEFDRYQVVITTPYGSISRLL